MKKKTTKTLLFFGFPSLIVSVFLHTAALVFPFFLLKVFGFWFFLRMKKGTDNRRKSRSAIGFTYPFFSDLELLGIVQNEERTKEDKAQLVVYLVSVDQKELRLKPTLGEGEKMK